MNSRKTLSGMISDHGQTPLGAGALLILCALVYWPGLRGDFLFDDWSNLPLLGMYGAIDNVESLVLYLLSGFSGPTGRPLSHLSFLLDARDWPAPPASFKRTNLIIHLINGAILFGLLRQLTLALGVKPSATAKAALLATALWLLNPYWVSTTLYIVQRMTQLSALFTFAGLWLYAWGRTHYAPRCSLRLVSIMALAIAGCGLPATLAKENGALLPLLVIVLELTVLGAHDKHRQWTPTQGFYIARWLLLGLPTLLVLAYMARSLPALLEGDAGVREFTPGQRLLTQGRILWDYLFNILVPRPYPGGLFNDDIVISTGLLQPWHTLLAWLGWIVVAAWAIWNRLHRPAAALAILFFLAGHLLESSFLQLELYFEHRNYLPAAMFGLLPALWLSRADTSRVTEPLRRVIALGLISAFAALTLVRADLWGTPFAQALKWAQTHPHSPRAQHYLASFWHATGNREEVLRLNHRALTLDPTALAPLIELTTLNCGLGHGLSADIQAIESKIRLHTYPQSIVTMQLSRLLDFLLDGRCPNVSISNTLDLIARLEKTHLSMTNIRFLVMLKQREGRGWLMLSKPERAMAAFLSSQNVMPAEGVRLNNVATLASLGYHEHAIDLLDREIGPTKTATGLHIATLKARYMDHIGYYPRERRSLRETLIADIAAKESSPTASDPSKPSAMHK